MAAYVPNYGGNWQTGAGGGTPITEAALDNLETQYACAAADLIAKATLDAHSIIMAVLDNTPVVLAVAASRIVGRAAAGNIDDLTPAQVMAILSGQAGADFAMNTHKITGVVDPGANQDAATKKYVDDNDVDATHEFTVPALGPYNTGTESNLPAGYRSIRLNLANMYCHFPFKIPHDFTNLTSAVIVYVNVPGGGSGTVDWTADTAFAATGEAYNTHTDQATANALSTEGAQLMKELDISAAFTGIAADDHFNCRLQLDAVADSGEIYVLYLVFKYS